MDERTRKLIADMSAALMSVESRYSTRFGEYCICDAKKVEEALRSYHTWTAFEGLRYRREQDEVIDLEPEQSTHVRRALSCGGPEK